MKRITIICHEPLMTAANHSHVLLRKASALNTYTSAGYEDALVNRYAVSSGDWTEAQIAGIYNPNILDSPDLAPLLIANGGIVDPVLAAQAQAATAPIWDGVGDTPQARPDTILVFQSADAATAHAQIAAAGLVPVESGGP